MFHTQVFLQHGSLIKKRCYSCYAIKQNSFDCSKNVRSKIYYKMSLWLNIVVVVTILTNVAAQPQLPWSKIYNEMSSWLNIVVVVILLTNVAAQPLLPWSKIYNEISSWLNAVVVYFKNHHHDEGN